MYKFHSFMPSILCTTMNSNWKAIYNILEKDERVILGLMSGTSLDGLDIALCAIKGSGIDTKLSVLNFTTIPFKKDFKEEIKKIFSKKLADLQLLTVMNEKIGSIHAELILEALSDWQLDPSAIDIIASHGQTIFHAPKSLHRINSYPNATLQIGDGDHIAVKTGVITVADFRQKHIAAGGEGAPLAVYGDYLLFSKIGEARIMLNIGGIANLTFLPGDANAIGVFSTDIGPGNTIMDQYVQANYTDLYFDQNGDIAAKGSVNNELLIALKDLDFFEKPFPKTTGPELFNLSYLKTAQSASNTTAISKEDVLATLNRLTASVIVDAIKSCIGKHQSVTVFYSGGGIHNKLLINYLKADLPGVIFSSTEELGVHPDAKEAVLFALLANETLVGEPIDFGNSTGIPTVFMGKICFPH